MKLEKVTKEQSHNKIIEEQDEGSVSPEVTHVALPELAKDLVVAGNPSFLRPDPHRLISGIELKDDYGRITNNIPTLIYNHHCGYFMFFVFFFVY